ncbi:MAG: hypothetical protein HY055_05875 [Magnetospirillum sp.]|nr:hypothetical protein [Magnetospirillum sp.]
MIRQSRPLEAIAAGRLDLAYGVLAALVLVARSPDSFFLPALQAEDATQVLNFYVSHPETVFQYYAGYVSILTDLLGFGIVSLLPLSWVAHGCAWIALVFAAGAVSAVASHGSRNLGLSPMGGAALALVLPFSATYPVMMAATLFYALWNMLVWGAFLTLAPLRGGPIRRGLRLGAEALLLTANPVSALLLPCWAWRAIRDVRAGRAYWPDLIRLGVVGLVCLLLTEPVPISAGDAAASFWTGATRILQLWLGGGVFEAAFGKTLHLRTLHHLGEGWVIAMAVLVLTLSMALAGPTRRRHAGLLMTLSVAVLAVVALQRPEKIEIVLSNARRYIYIPHLLAKATLVTASLSPGNGIRRRLVVGGVLAILGWGIVLDYRPPSAAAQAEGRAVQAFLAQSEAAMAQGEAGPFILERGQWSLRVIRPDSSPDRSRSGTTIP